MRRKDREMDKEFALSIIDKATYGNLATLNDDGTPYVIPISVARLGESVYMHSAKAGKKIDNIKKNSIASMTFVGDVKVPDKITKGEYQEAISSGSVGRALAKKFTTEFESTVAFGKIYIVDNTDEKIKGLQLLSEKYTPDMMEYFNEAANASINAVEILRFDIEEITGKRKKYDSKGEEMKWGRME